MGKRCNILFLGEGDSFGDICYSLNLYSAKLGMKAVVVLDITRKKKSKAMSWTGEIECISFSLSACGHILGKGSPVQEPDLAQRTYKLQFPSWVFFVKLRQMIREG